MGDTLAWNVIVNDHSDKGLGSFENNLKQTETKAKNAGKAIGVGLGAAGGVAAGLLAKGFADNMDIEAGRHKLQGQLGLTEADSAKAGTAAATVYGDNFGASMDEVNDSIKSVSDAFGGLGGKSAADIAKLSEKALSLSSVMGEDLTATTQAAGQMVKNGLAKNADEAFDILTKGFQNGTNASGDLLDTFNEYGPQFAKLGIDGPAAIGLLNQGLQAGARNTDIIADAFKEFSIRAVDGSALTAQGFKDVGLNAKDMSREIGAGGDRAAAATDQTIKALLAMKDPIKQNIAGTALFGTQWEDLGPKAFGALDLTQAKLTEVKGATDEMSAAVGDTAAARIETAKRKFEQWTQSMSSSSSVMGTVVTGMLAFGGGAVTAASQLGTLALAFRGTAAAEMVTANATKVLSAGLKLLKAAWLLALGPVGLIIAGLALVAAGLIYAYKHSEKFRTIVNQVTKAVANSILWLADKWLQAWEIMFGVLGKLPGKFGAPFRAAARSVAGLREKVNGLRGDINRLHGKEVRILVRTEYRDVFDSEVRRDKATAGRRASGGDVWAGHAYTVGEEGVETFVPDVNGHIVPHAATSKALATGGGGFTLNVHINAGTVIGNSREFRDAIVDAISRAPAGSRKIPAGAIARR